MNVLIVGGGIVGLSVAHRLARAGETCTLVDSGAPGQEASAAAGGMVAPQMEAHEPGPLLQLGLLSRQLWPAFAAQLEEESQTPIELRRFGALRVALQPEQAEELSHTAQWQQKLGLKLQLLNASEARALEPNLSPHVLAALHFPEDLQVHPPSFIRSLLAAALNAGVRVQRKHVQGVVERAGRVVGAQVEGQLLEADCVVVATGAWSASLLGLPLPPQAVFPCRGQLLDVDCQRPLFRHFVMAPGAYAIPRTEGTLTLGSTMENVGFDKNNTAQGLSHILNMAQNYCPKLADASFVRCWAGLRPATEDGLPILSKTPQGLVLATGHFRNGIAAAPFTAQLVEELLYGKPLSLDIAPFSHTRFANALV